MTMLPYSLHNISADGDLVGPRWLLHLVKVMTSLSLAFGMIAIGVSPLYASIAASVGLMALIVARQWRNEEKHLIASGIDKMNDLALACVALACGMKLTFGWLAGLGVLAVCVLVWTFTHRYATP